MSETMNYGSGKTLRNLSIRIAIPSWKLLGRNGMAQGNGVSQTEIRSLFRDELQDLRIWQQDRKDGAITGQRAVRPRACNSRST